MRQFNFIPPSGCVYVGFKDEAGFKETASGLHVMEGHRHRAMSATVVAVPPGSDAKVGDRAIFHRSSLHDISEGDNMDVFFLAEEKVLAWAEGGAR